MMTRVVRLNLKWFRVTIVFLANFCGLMEGWEFNKGIASVISQQDFPLPSLWKLTLVLSLV